MAAKMGVIPKVLRNHFLLSLLLKYIAYFAKLMGNKKATILTLYTIACVLINFSLYRTCVMSGGSINFGDCFFFFCKLIVRNKKSVMALWTYVLSSGSFSWKRRQLYETVAKSSEFWLECDESYNWWTNFYKDHFQQ